MSSKLVNDRLSPAANLLSVLGRVLMEADDRRRQKWAADRKHRRLLYATLPGFCCDSSEWIAAFEAPVRILGEALAHLIRERWNSVSSSIRERQAMQAYDTANTSVVRGVEDLFRYTGLQESAEPIRPHRRSATALAEPPGDESRETVTEGSEESPEEPASASTLPDPRP